MSDDMPPDPDKRNVWRARFANSAIFAFSQASPPAYESSLDRLLCCLMHWSDRNGENFEAELNQAKLRYNRQTRKE